MSQGGPREQETSPQTFDSLPEEGGNLLQSFAAAFFKDLHDLDTNMSLYWISRDASLALHNLQIFDQSAYSAYAPLFQYFLTASENYKFRSL